MSTVASASPHCVFRTRTVCRPGWLQPRVADALFVPDAPKESRKRLASPDHDQPNGSAWQPFAVAVKVRRWKASPEEGPERVTAEDATVKVFVCSLSLSLPSVIALVASTTSRTV